MVLGRAKLGVCTWVPGVWALSRVGWPKYELMLGWKGRLKERFVVDMVSVLYSVRSIVIAPCGR